MSFFKKLFGGESGQPKPEGEFDPSKPLNPEEFKQDTSAPETEASPEATEEAPKEEEAPTDSPN